MAVVRLTSIEDFSQIFGSGILLFSIQNYIKLADKRKHQRQIDAGGTQRNQRQVSHDESA